MTENNLNVLFYDATKPSSYYGLDKLYRAIKKKNNQKISRKEVQEWLENQDAYTLHKQRRLRYPRRPYNINNINDVWEADLVDLRSIKSYNDNNSYILVVIDVLSKYVWCEILRDKTSSCVAKAFEKILSRSNKRIPIILQSDQGKEFTGTPFQSLLKSKNIIFRIARSPDVKAAVAERFNRTLKERMWRYFTNFNTKRYVDVLESLVDSYNHSRHSSIKMAPCDVNLKNAYLAKINLQKKYNDHLSNVEPKYKVGDLVRISTAKNVFAKAYEGNFSEEIFKIIRISKTRIPYVYILEDLKGEEIDGIFYEQELSRVRKDLANNVFIIDKIIRSAGKGHNKKYLVSWAGYPKSFDSWIPATELKHL